MLKGLRQFQFSFFETWRPVHLVYRRISESVSEMARLKDYLEAFSMHHRRSSVYSACTHNRAWVISNLLPRSPVELLEKLDGGKRRSLFRSFSDASVRCSLVSFFRSNS